MDGAEYDSLFIRYLKGEYFFDALAYCLRSFANPEKDLRLRELLIQQLPRLWKSAEAKELLVRLSNGDGAIGPSDVQAAKESLKKLEANAPDDEEILP